MYYTTVILIFVSICHGQTGGILSAKCLEPYSVTGMCKAGFPRYTYKSLSNTCEYFLYGGCHATANIFETRETAYLRV